MTDFELHKTAMAEAYNRKAADYGRARNTKFDEFLSDRQAAFVGAVRTVGTRIVDLGCGPGHESARFLHEGLQPVCVDLAPGMVTQCRERGLEAHVMDFCQLDFPAGHFAGAWMSFSLLHVPKSIAPEVIAGISRVMVDDGAFYVALFEGTGEGVRDEDVKQFGTKRYFSYYQPEELQSLLEPYFDALQYARLDISPRPTISFLGRKRKVR